MIYEYKCSNCGEVFEKILPLRDMKAPLGGPCPVCFEVGNISRYISTAPGIADPVGLGRIKASSDLRNRLSQIKSENPGSNIKER